MNCFEESAGLETCGNKRMSIGYAMHKFEVAN